MADAEDIQPLVCDNGTGMVKVQKWSYFGMVISILFIHTSRISIQYNIKLNRYESLVCIYLQLNLILKSDFLWILILYDESWFILMRYHLNFVYPAPFCQLV
jgi:hypothetical protein